MKLETSLELLERLRHQLAANEGSIEPLSYYRVAKVLNVAHSAVLRWKAAKGGMTRELAPVVANLLGETPEYVLACIEHDREPSADVRKIWKRIAEAFRSKAAAIASAIILAPAALGLFPGKSEASTLQFNEPQYALCEVSRSRWRRLRAWLRALFQAFSPAPVPS